MGAGGSIPSDLVNVTTVCNISGYDTGSVLKFRNEIVNLSPDVDKGADHAKNRPLCPFTPEYPLYYVPGNVVLQLSSIPTHEQLLQHNAILRTSHAQRFEYSQGVPEDGWGTGGTEYINTEMLVLPDGNYLSTAHRRVFFSHRWVQGADGRATPDDENNTKLSKLKTLIKASDLIWFDYMCIPQAAEKRSEQLAAIASLPYYISLSDEVHVLTTDSVNNEQYKTRAFTNIELVCANLWMVTGGFQGSSLPSQVKTAPLCATFGSDGRPCYPYRNPIYADMYNPADLPAIVQVVEVVKGKLHETIAWCKKHDSKCSAAEKLLAFLSTET